MEHGIGSLNGAINVHEADAHTVPVNKYFSRETGSSATLVLPSEVGDINITVSSGAVFSVGNFVEFIDEPNEPIYRRITAISVDVITIDAPLDNAHSAGATLIAVTIDMNVIGSLLAPVSFKFKPDAGSPVWHIVRFLFSMVHGTAGDLGLFGNLPALTNGAVLRGYDGASGTFRTFMNIKSNADMKNNMYDVDFDARSGGGGSYGTSGRGSIKIGTGAVPKLNASNGDYFEILIQDDISGLNSFRMKVQGHIEGQ